MTWIKAQNVYAIFLPGCTTPTTTFPGSGTPNKLSQKVTKPLFQS